MIMDLDIHCIVEPAVMHGLYRYCTFKGYPSISSCVVHILIRFLSEQGYF